MDDTQTLAAIIPQEFKDRPYLKELSALPLGPDGYTALFKKLDGAETLVGKKTGLPAPDAPEAEWDQLFAKIRPETEEAYEIKTREGETADPDFARAMKKAFHTAGLTKSQAAKMQEQFHNAIGTKRAEQAKAQQAIDTEFDTLTKATFGADNEKALAQARGMLEQFTPVALRPHVARLSNEALVILAGVLNAVHTKYGGEDTVSGGGRGAVVPDLVTIREEGRTLMALPEYRDFSHPKNKDVMARVHAIYTELAKAGVK